MRRFWTDFCIAFWAAYETAREMRDVPDDDPMAILRPGAGIEPPAPPVLIWLAGDTNPDPLMVQPEDAALMVAAECDQIRRGLRH